MILKLINCDKDNHSIPINYDTSAGLFPFFSKRNKLNLYYFFKNYINESIACRWEEGILFYGQKMKFGGFSISKFRKDDTFN